MTPPTRWRSLLELFTLAGFALALPVLSIFGRAADQFTLRSASGAQVVGFGLVAVVVPPLAIWCVELAAAVINPDLGEIVHRLAIVLLVAAFIVQLVPEDWPRAVAMVAAIAGGVLVAVLRQRWLAVRLWLTYAAVAPLGFLALFLFASSTGALISPDSSYAEVHPEAPAPPVVVIVLDELPLTSLIGADGQLDGELYPNLASLAADAHWFRNTTSIAALTWHAAPALLTGRVPNDDEGPSLADHPQNLFTLLGGTYDLHVQESSTQLCPPDACPRRSTADVSRDLWADVRKVLGTRLRLTDAAFQPVGPLAQGHRTIDEFLLDLSAAPGTLSFLHLFLPHSPYEYLPDGSRYHVPFGLLGQEDDGAIWSEERSLARLARQRHLLQTAYADGLVGRVLDQMREDGTYDDALIVVTADHGMSFEPGGSPRAALGEGLDPDLAADLLWVPFFLKEPGQVDGSVDDRNVLTVDVLPTVADVLDVDIPWHVDGRSALGDERTSTEKPWYPARPGTYGVGVGDPETIDVRTTWPRVLERSLASILPAAGEHDRLWRIGPSSDLVGGPLPDGLRAEELDLVVSSTATRSDGRHVFVRAHGQQEVLQVGDEVAVTVDGIVGATATAIDVGEGPEIRVILDPSRMRSSEPAVEFHRIG